MSKISSFEDLVIWQESMAIAVVLYKEFSNCKDFAFRDQILKASVSVPSNISEGFERNNDKEFFNFLRYAKGSAGEVRTQLILAKSVGLTTNPETPLLINRLITLSKQIQSLMNSINRKLGR
ncbi:four helix bundle protein [uncultured Arcticibacterium sp.]|uniref:four helix bundle protein n=1 Tax=uncultured Arcticibacterium sp. TaxID=2173042 RepID=UPI0030F8407B